MTELRLRLRQAELPGLWGPLVVSNARPERQDRGRRKATPPGGAQEA